MTTSFPNLRELFEASGEVARTLGVQALVSRCANAKEQLARASHGARLFESHGGRCQRIHAPPVFALT